MPHLPRAHSPGCLWQYRTVPVYALGESVPDISPDAYVSPDAVVIGAVVIGAESSVWPGAVLRGDHGRIIVGMKTSVQDGSVLHCTGTYDTVIGDRCTIGHNAHLEGCTIHDDSLIGSGAVILPGCVVGPHALVGAAALVPEGRVLPPFSRALGVPARVTEDAVGPEDFSRNVDAYVGNVRKYHAQLRRLD